MKTETTLPRAAGQAAHQWSSDTFADISDLSQAHWHYEGTPSSSQTALRIEFPGHRVSIQLDRQILRACNSHAALVAALENIAAIQPPLMSKEAEKGFEYHAAENNYRVQLAALILGVKEQARAALQSAKP